VPAAVRDDGAEARRIAKRSVAAMLTAYTQTASAATRAAMSEHGRPEDFADAMSRLTRGEAAEDAIDDRLLAEYAIAGTPEECLAQVEGYAEAGVTELAMAPIGEHPAEDIARLRSAIR
jgi:alkanesulfonate monooxygenase SsuD/methylene tetrahydromethanopterin reductase-like flavin-dependent oxidoreductase (luciferase family)